MSTTRPTAEELQKLVTELIRATSQKKVTWTDTPQSDCFITTVGDSLVQVRQKGNLIHFNSCWMKWFEVELMNSEGQIAETLSSMPENTGIDAIAIEPELLNDLYQAAKNSALQTSNVVQDLLHSLSAIR